MTSKLSVFCACSVTCRSSRAAGRADRQDLPARRETQADGASAYKRTRREAGPVDRHAGADVDVVRGVLRELDLQPDKLLPFVDRGHLGLPLHDACERIGACTNKIFHLCWKSSHRKRRAAEFLSREVLPKWNVVGEFIEETENRLWPENTLLHILPHRTCKQCPCGLTERHGATLALSGQKCQLPCRRKLRTHR